ncbi:hypothetical protein [Microbacterium sp. NPDC076895]|uniref:hypothetical protein n=1 Tax=Microbacterium sp. NPDC076895 TaxID=3154957 RepID=UPI00344345F8
MERNETTAPATFSERLKREGWKTASVLAIAGLALAGCAPEGSEPTATTPAAVETTTPGPEVTEDVPTIEEMVAAEADPHAFDIPLDATPEEFVAKWNDWMNAMETTHLAGDIYTAEYSDAYLLENEFEEKVAKAQIDLYYDAQFKAGWRDDSAINGIYENNVNNALGDYASWNGGQDVLERSQTVDAFEVITQSDEKVVILIDAVTHYKGDPDNPNVAKLDGYVDTTAVTWIPEGDRWVLNGWN